MTDVSIVVTNWNYGEYLNDAIGSIEAQTRPPESWYIIDDGSTDDASLAIYEGLEPERVVYVGIQRGAVAAYQRGLDECETRWIVYLDADDMLPDNYIAATMETALQCGVPWVYTDTVYIDAEGNQTGRLTQPGFDPGRLRSGNFIHSAALIEAELIRRAGGWKEDPLEDWNLWRRVADLGVTAAHCGRTFHYYRKHGPSRMSTQRGM